MTAQDLMNKIEWVNKRCSLKSGPLTTSQIELLMFVFADNVVNKNSASDDVSGSFTYEDLQQAFCAGCDFQRGEHESWETYNKFTGNQQPNKELNFEMWYEQNYR